MVPRKIELEVVMLEQKLGHPDLPQFVGGMKTAVYQPE